jgi:hypothetical protein
LAQIRRSAVDANLREVRSKAAALAVDDVARRAAELRVVRAPFVGIAGVLVVAARPSERT